MTDAQIVEKLKDEGKQVLIYGNANHAGLVYEYLRDRGVEAANFVVDDQYYTAGMTLKNKPVLAIGQCDIENSNIVLGFCNVEKTKFIMNNKQIVKGNYYLLWEPLSIYEWDEEYLSVNRAKFDEIENDLADEMSKKILRTLMKAKVNCEADEMLLLADDTQYFNELTYQIDPREEILCDCGAFNGDTVRKFYQFTNGNYKKIYAFEPNNENLAALKKNTQGVQNLVLVNKGTWNEDTTLSFSMDGSASLIDDAGEVKIDVTAIDNVVGDDKVTFIKMDVEGSEMESLIGAAKTIAKNMPKLAICCYHKTNDIIGFYDYIKTFENAEKKYNFYLRHHSNSVYETVLYAIPVAK